MLLNGNYMQKMTKAVVFFGAETRTQNKLDLMLFGVPGMGHEGD